MNYGFLSLLPALVTIAGAIITRQVALALLFGVMAGATVIGHFSLMAGGEALVKYLYAASADLDRLGIAFFVLLVGGLLDILAVSGAYSAFGDRVANILDTPRKARLANWLLSLSLFFDDYANALITGATMRPITDRHRISPALLAYLVDVLATFASVVFLSTWACFEGSLMQEAGASVGIKQSATEFLIRSLPYHFYTYLSMLFTLVVAASGKWFGVRLDRQPISTKHGSLHAIGQNVRPVHAVAPLAFLIICAIAGVLATGYWQLRQENIPDISLMAILGRAPTIHVLVIATGLALIFCTMMLRRDRVLSLREISRSFFAGLARMLVVAIIILMANGLAKVSDDLGTGRYITTLLSSSIPTTFIPTFIFVLSLLVTIATGFSWSSMAIVMPVAYQLAMTGGQETLIPVVSAAVISGAISGSQVVPFSDTSVIAATAYGITPVYHVKTQFLQILATIAVAVLGFTALGAGVNVWLCYLTGAVILVAIHVIWSKEALGNELEHN